MRNLKLQPPNSALTLLHSGYVHMRGEMNSNWYEILFRLKILFGVQSVFYLCSHKLRQNENQTGMVFMLDILTEMKFQTGEIFITTKFTQSKINKHKLFGYCIYNACAFETHCSHFARNEIRVIKYQVIKCIQISYYWVVLKYSQNEKLAELAFLLVGNLKLV